MCWPSSSAGNLTDAERIARPRRVHVRGVFPAGEVRPRAKRAALRRKHNAAAGWIGVQRLEDVGQAPNQLDIEKIVRWPANFDDRDMVVTAYSIS